MTAFDAIKPGSGDTGLASLFATTATPAAGAQTGGEGDTPFAQLLSQLNTLPMPASGPQAPAAPAAPETAPQRLATLPVPPFRQPVSVFAEAPQQADRTPVLECGLRLPDTGKMLPTTAHGGSILPADATIEKLPGEKPGSLAELPVTDQPTGPEGEIAQSMSLPIIHMTSSTPQPVPVAVPALPVRTPAGSMAQGRQAIVNDGALPAVAAPAIEAAPAVTLTVADAPVDSGGDMPSAPDQAFREAGFAGARTRSSASPAMDLHPAAGTPDLVAAAPQTGPEPQHLAMQDLTQIVERLAAAREAAAPATTQLAVEHAEFGPLSLSIRQGDGGELSIAVAAADRDSQAALVAAIAQGEAPGFEQAPDRRGGESAQRDPASAGQPGDGRGQGAQRDRFAGQQQRQPMPQREPARERDGETRSGTYA